MQAQKKEAAASLLRSGIGYRLIYFGQLHDAENIAAPRQPPRRELLKIIIY